MSDTANATNNSQETGAGAVANAVSTPPTVETSPQPSESVAGTSPSTDKKKTPKRPRRSFIERAQEESEELVRTMGGSLELDGGRRTRSSTRGTPRSAPVETPPPSKKGRTSSPTSTPTSAKSGRSRARKNIAAAIDEPETSVQKEEVATNVEKKVEEPTNAEPKPAAKSNNETASVEESNVNTDSSSEKDTIQSEDKTDAVGDLKSIPEEQQNNVAHIVADSSENETESEHTETKTTKEVAPKPQVTPMEVDEDQEEVKATEVEKKSETITTKTEENSPPAAPVIVVTPAAPVATDEATKESTPEAMEVDSVSKSNNATVEPKLLVDSNKPENEVVEATTAVPTPTVNEAKEISSITEAAKVDSAPIVVPNNATKSEISKVESIPPPPPSTQNIISVEKNIPLAETASKNVELNLSNSAATPIVDGSAAGETDANTTSPVKKLNATEQPSEPTIKSAAETSDNTTTNVSTPQVCN